MTNKEKEYLKELAFRGLTVDCIISQAYFCGEPINESPITSNKA